MSIMGRPTKYDSKYCEMLLEHMDRGLSFEAFAGMLKVSKVTLYNWTREYPEFLNAKKIGTAASQYWWEQQGQDGLWSTTERQGNSVTTKAMNSAIWIFNMKNRFKWADRQEQEIKVSEIKIDADDKDL